MKKAFAVLTLLAAPLCLAQTESEVREPDRILYKKLTIMDFDDVKVEGELDRGAGIYEIVRPKAKFKSMVGVRANFNAELHRSVDAL